VRLSCPCNIGRRTSATMRRRVTTLASNWLRDGHVISHRPWNIGLVLIGAFLSHALLMASSALAQPTDVSSPQLVVSHVAHPGQTGHRSSSLGPPVSVAEAAVPVSRSPCDSPESTVRARPSQSLLELGGREAVDRSLVSAPPGIVRRALESFTLTAGTRRALLQVFLN
jgi:hypothetical protein